MQPAPRDRYFAQSSPSYGYETILGGAKVLFALNGFTSIHRADNRDAELPTDKEVPLIGTVAAALTSSQIMESFCPDFVISAGTAGGFEGRAAKTGDCILSKCVRYHDRRILIPGFREVAESPLPLYKHVQDLADRLRIKTGTVCTGDSFALSGSDIHRLRDLQTDAIEMEAAAIAYVCSLSKVPFVALKVITDLVDTTEKSAEDQFLENLKMSSERLCHTLEALIQEITRSAHLEH